jgi:murein DD-endopeptidase MepM/ murein hydrolase activator NlpD
MGDWRRQLLRHIGAPSTPQNLKFLSGWQRWEGGHTNNSARFNWLNTTHGAGSSINSVGVKAFGDFKSGIRYTAETLQNGRYDDIVGGLMKGNPYKSDLSSGLSTWVSGSPTGNLAYAQKVMGGSATLPAAPAVGRGPKGNPGLVAPPPSKPWGSGSDYDKFVNDIWGDLAPLYRSTFGGVSSYGEPTARPEWESPETPLKRTGKGFMFPTTPKGTHVSSGLDWGTKTAEDIMAAPGTAVQAPMGGQVVYWHPAGAQGGGSMLIRLDNGREYWMGHIANGVKAGTRFKKGHTLALVSSDHRAPHLHIDSRGR